MHAWPFLFGGILLVAVTAPNESAAGGQESAELAVPGKSLEVVLPVGDDVAGAVLLGGTGRLALSTLRVQFEGKAAGDTVQVRLNGDVLKSAEEDAESGWVTYAADPSQVRHGNNVLAFRVGDARKTTKPLVVRSVELRVNHKQAKEVSK